jgi:hypothetical protein
MGNAESSLHLRGLPVDVIALQVTPMLDIKDFVALDTAGAMASSGALQEAQSLMQPIELPYTLNRSVGVWLLKHGYSLRGCTVRGVNEVATELTSVMEQYSEQVHDVHLRLPNNRDETIKLLPRTSNLWISGPVTYEQIEELCLSAHKVTELSVDRVAGSAQPGLVSQLLWTVPKLRDLSCSCECLGTAIPALQFMGVKLRKLSLTACTTNTSAELFAEVSSLCPNLEVISIATYGLTQNQLDIEAVLVTLAKNCRFLNRVSLYSNKLSTRGLRQLLCKCHSLRFLDWCGWTALDILAAAECDARLDAIDLWHPLAGGLVTYSTLFTHLQHVHLGRGFLGSPSAAAAVSCMCNLRSVEIVCGNSAAVVVDIGAVLQALVSCHGNYMVDIRFATALATILRSNRGITSLWLTDYGREEAIYTPIPAVLAKALVQCCNMQVLTIDCYNVTDHQMLPVLASMRRLSDCVIAATTKLSDAFFLTLTQHCRDLAALNVLRCTGYTEAALVQLIRRSHKFSSVAVHRSCLSHATEAALSAEKRLYKLYILVLG